MQKALICSRCLRTLRQRIGSESAQLPSMATRKPRYFSNQASEWQQVTRTSSTRVEPQTLIPPTTTGAITSNVTAPPPRSGSAAPVTDPSKPALPEVSVAEMQRQIASSLSRPDLATQLARRLRQTARSTTETYITYGHTEALFKSCAAQARYMIPEDQRMSVLTGKGPPKTADGVDLGVPEADSWWFAEAGLLPTFSTWSQVTYLHMYLLTVRLRALSSATAFQNYQRYLLEHFSHAAEDKMVIQHNLTARSIRNKYLKDLFLQWRGILAAYDEGLVKGDAVLAGAVWRNLYRGQEDVDWEKVATVVGFMRKAINILGHIEIDEMFGKLDGPKGLWALSRRDLDSLVQKPSRGLSESLAER